MLEVKDLTKVFKSSKKERKCALDKVSFKLPNHGFAFIVGKSGSGKTTLLSLIGGLESITSGDVIFEGRSFRSFKRKEFDAYRNNEVGFIFQDYHLLEELTIFDNIKMMLDFKQIKNDDLIYQALKDVGLEGYESRYPKELSGGEKQRVAIARIIVKNPSIILADEPTGNLDRKTTKLIFDMLKKLSMKKLVIAVSHSTIDAYKYADYILELVDGKILNKYKKSDNQKDLFRIENNCLYVSKDVQITENEVKNIKKSLKSNKINIVEENLILYEKYREDFNEEENIKFNRKKHIKFLDSLRYSFKFFKGNILKTTIFSFIISCIISICGISQLLATTNAEKAYNRFLEKTNFETLSIVNNNSYFPLEEDKLIEYDKLGKTYKGITNPYFIDVYFDKRTINIDDIFDVIYINNDDLNSKFKEDDNSIFLLKKEKEIPNGLYVTDFLMDCILKKEYTVNDLKNIVENGYYDGINCLAVNGVINTHYKEKYKNVYKYVLNNLKDQVPKKYNKEYINFMHEINNKLGFCYTTNFSWYEDTIKYDLNHLKMGNSIFTYEECSYGTWKNLYSAENQNLNFEVKDDEIILSEEVAKRFKDDIKIAPNSTKLIDEPFYIDLSLYDYRDNFFKNPLINKSLKVIGINSFASFVNNNTLKECLSGIKRTWNLIIEDVKDQGSIQLLNKENGYKNFVVEEFYIKNYVRFTDSLKDFFLFIFIILVATSLLLILLYSLSSFNNRLFETGVMKALGARDIDIINSMLINFLTGLCLTLLLSNALVILLTPLANSFLLTGISKISDYNTIFNNCDILFITPIYLLVFNLIIILAFLICFLVQFLKTRFLKPINIIKAKE